MNLFTKALAFAAAFMALPSLASAIGITVVNSSVPAGSVLNDGDTVTFDLRLGLDDPAGTLYGLGVTVDGYDQPDPSFIRDGGLAFQSATVVNHAFGLNLGSGPQFGLDNTTAGVELYQSNQLNPVAYTTSLFQGVNTGPAAGTGSSDLGIAGNSTVTGGSPDVHFQVTFVASILNGQNPVASTFSFNTLAVRAGGATEADSATFGVTVIPEPGTALLMGLGLVGLAANRRR
jgi:hypothetical protein